MNSQELLQKSIFEATVSETWATWPSALYHSRDAHMTGVTFNILSLQAIGDIQGHIVQLVT